MWELEFPQRMNASHASRLWLPSDGLAAVIDTVGAAIAVGPADAHVRGQAAERYGTAFTTTDGTGLEQALCHARPDY
jgi:hypothetical protein